MTTNVVTDEQLGVLARRQNDLFRRVREGTLPVGRVLEALQGTIEGNFDVAPKPSGRFIDCDAQPYLPDGWSINPTDQITSRVRGQIEFDPAKVTFHLAEAQKTGTIMGNELLKLLEGQPVLPANVLDALLANTAEISDSWKQDKQGNSRYIYFWGTIYRGRDGFLFVRCLCWGDGRWYWGCVYLTSGFGAGSSAAIL